MNHLTALPSSLVPVLNLADRVATVGSTAADRAIAVWSFFTQPQAIATYRWLGAMTLAMVHLAWVCLVWVYVQIKCWVDVEVYLSTPIKADVFLATTEELFAQADEVAARSMPQAMTPAIAVCRLAPSTSHEDGLDRRQELEDMTLKQLVPLAESLGKPTRKVRKAWLIDSILHAEGYEI